MDSILRFASGRSNVDDDGVRDVYIKSNLTIELDRVVKRMIAENGSSIMSIDDDGEEEDDTYVERAAEDDEEEEEEEDDDDCFRNRILIETPTVSLLCDILEAILLHGLKAKLSSRMSSMFGGSGGHHYYFGGSNHHNKRNNHNNNNQSSTTFSLDYWPVVAVLCHHEDSRHLRSLRNISTDIGRCRAWLRSALNDGLFRSYLDTLIGDSGTLNRFYRPTAYVRDAQHTEMLHRSMIDIERYIFRLTIDDVDLNFWSTATLRFLGFDTSATQDDSLVVTALDAIHLISESKSSLNKHESSSSPSSSSHEKVTNINFDIVAKSEPQQSMTESMHSNRISIESEEKKEEISSRQSKTPVNEIPRNSDDDDDDNVAISTLRCPTFELEQDSTTSQDNNNFDNEKENIYSGNSLSVNSGWSTKPMMIADESYDAILESYSPNRVAAVLSSTPDINDVRHSIESMMDCSASPDAAGFAGKNHSAQSSATDNDFEIIPKSVVLNNSDADNRRFFDQLCRIAPEHGLDEQDYKCHLCGRPIGMIYGKSRLCHIDGHLYCTECNGDDDSMIPAQIIYNWNFSKFSIATHNKKRLATIEAEPLFDIKQLSPLLYSVIDEMIEMLDLRTQLFFLHAYLFTCQEQVALKMRKMVWPREHLFEHIHLYSIEDLTQVYGNTLPVMLRQVIAFARKHVSGCSLCKLKGYYCEICKGSQILYPFDTGSTKRCESCKSVFHARCFDEKYDKHSCPKCLRMLARIDRS